jgi:nucleotide-binding universal stress UspA family protein
MPRFSTILVPIDFSEVARGALQVAIALARPGARLIVLHVIEAVHIASEGYREAREARLREHEAVDPGVPVDYLLREGDPPEEVLKLAAELHPDVIVVGSHGRTGLDRLLMGSVAEAILRGSPIPVVVVRTPRDS